MEMKKILILAVILCFLSNTAFCQLEEDNHLRISLTIEPVNFFLKGYSFWAGIKYRKFEAGVVTFSAYSENNFLFENSDDLDIKLRNGTALYTRFYPLNSESSPFLGFLIGYESWRIRGKQEPIQENILRNAFFTPQVGYQWVTLNRRLLVNPNVRFILPFAENGPSETNGISNELKNFGFIPALDIGIGLYKN